MSRPTPEGFAQTETQAVCDLARAVQALAAQDDAPEHTSRRRLAQLVANRATMIAHDQPDCRLTDRQRQALVRRLG